MRSLPVRVVGMVIGAAVLVGGWLFFAPEKLGGSMTYSVTSGISMEPLLHKNDLAFVRHQSEYQVGDAVLYQSSVVGKPVLHRIILIQDGHYFFQGDNNDFVDPGYATRDELTGTMWFRITDVGALLGWFGTPAHSALLGAAATIAIVVTSTRGASGRRRRRRRKGSKMNPPDTPFTPDPPLPAPTMPQPTSVDASVDTSRAEDDREPWSDERRARHREEQSARRSGESGEEQRSAGGDEHRGERRDERGDQWSEQRGKRRPPPFLDGPPSTLVALAIATTLAVLLLMAGFTQPLQRGGIRPNSYEQSGAFAYSAIANGPNDVYANNVVNTGDPVYRSLVDNVNVSFDWQFESELDHEVQGTIALKALVLSEVDTWQEASTIAPITNFVGDSAETSVDLPLESLYTLIESVTTQSGIDGANYSVVLQPVVHVTGKVDGQPIDKTFSPSLPIAVTMSAIRVDVAATPPPTGATFEATDASDALFDALHPSETGSTPDQVANELSIAKYHFAVSQLRKLGIFFAVAAAVIAVVHDRRRRKGSRRSYEEQIAAKAKALIVPVSVLGATPGRPPVSVPDFAQLAGLARFLERPILYEVRDGARTYAVDDDGIRYVTTAIDRRQARSADSGPHQRRVPPGPTDAAGPPPTPPPAPAATPVATPDPAPVESAVPAQLVSARGATTSRLPPLTASTRRRPRRAAVLRAGGAVLVLVFATTLTLTLTASTTVPVSRAGLSVQPGQVSQASPTGCSSLALTQLVRVTGSYSNSVSNALILGSPGVDTINVTGASNCIVGGGGKDAVTSTTTSVCIVGPTAGSTYSKCVSKAR